MGYFKTDIWAVGMNAKCIASVTWLNAKGGPKNHDRFTVTGVVYDKGKTYLNFQEFGSNCYNAAYFTHSHTINNEEFLLLN